MPSDVAFAEWLLDSLEAFVRAELANHLMQAMPAGRSNRIRAINGFFRGCAGRISARLRALSTVTVSGNSQALVVTKTGLIKSAMAAEGIKLRAASSAPRVTDHDSMLAGRAAGERASFGRPISGNGATLRIGSK